MAYDFKFGDTAEGMQTLREIGMRSSPLAGYRPFAKTIQLGNLKLKGQGFPIVTWHWAVITMDERDALIGDMDDALSVPRFIRTRLPDNSWATFQTVQNRPTGEENIQVAKIVGFDLIFTACVLIPDA